LRTIQGNGLRPMMEIKIRLQTIAQPSGKERGGTRSVMIQT